MLSAKELHPGKRNSLDALCERYFIDNSKRTLHGALADALLLAECYLAMTRGQESLMMELEAPAAAAAAAAGLILDVSKLIVQQRDAGGAAFARAVPRRHGEGKQRPEPLAQAGRVELVSLSAG